MLIHRSGFKMDFKHINGSGLANDKRKGIVVERSRIGKIPCLIFLVWVLGIHSSCGSDDLKDLGGVYSLMRSARYINGDIFNQIHGR